ARRRRSSSHSDRRSQVARPGDDPGRRHRTARLSPPLRDPAFLLPGGMAVTVRCGRRLGPRPKGGPATSQETCDVPATAGPGGSPYRRAQALLPLRPAAGRSAGAPEASARTCDVAAMILRRAATPRSLFSDAEVTHGGARSLYGSLGFLR